MFRYASDMDRGYDRWYRGAPRERGRYDWLDPGFRDGDRMRGRPPTGGGWSWGYVPYDVRAGYGGEYVAGWERENKSRARTDYGDPFGDRIRHTPIRAIRALPRGYDRGWRTNEYAADYVPRPRYGRYDTGYRTRMGDRPVAYDYWF